MKSLICAIDDTEREEDDDIYEDMASALYEDLGCTATEMRTAQQAEKGIKDLILIKASFPKIRKTNGPLQHRSKNSKLSTALSTMPKRIFYGW